MRPDVVDGRDVGMIQNAGRPRLLLEAPQAIRVGGKRRRQDFDRDVAPESRVLGPIDLPHPSRAEGGQDFVRAEACSGCQRHRARSTRKR